jgi:hypothetical protein
VNSLKRLGVFALAYLLFAVPLGSYSRAFAECPQPPFDRTHPTQIGDYEDCGATSWELVADYAGEEFDEGPYAGTGVCTGGYKLCNCNMVGSSFKVPTIEFQYEENDDGEGYYDYQWWWNVTNYDGDQGLETCSVGSGSCQSTGYAGETDPSYVDSNVGYDDEWEYCYQ